MSETWTFREYDGVEPPSWSDLTRLCGSIYDEEGRRIGMLGSKHSRIAAAAPDLLEALKAQQWNARGHFAEACSLLDPTGPCPDYCVQARAAIAKAEGAGLSGAGSDRP